MATLSRISSIAAALAAAVLLASGAARAQDSAGDIPVVDDIFAALTLEGVRCGEVTDVKPMGEQEFEAQCRVGGRYRLLPSGDGHLGVLTIVADVARFGLEVVESVLRLPGRILGFSGESAQHVSDVAADLLALVTLAGRDCDEVETVERRANDDHLLTCRNGSKHHVYSGEDGLVKVDTEE